VPPILAYIGLGYCACSTVRYACIDTCCDSGSSTLSTNFITGQLGIYICTKVPEMQEESKLASGVPTIELSPLSHKFLPVI